MATIHRVITTDGRIYELNQPPPDYEIPDTDEAYESESTTLYIHKIRKDGDIFEIKIIRVYDSGDVKEDSDGVYEHRIMLNKSHVIRYDDYS